jgi:DNA-binding Xre family transcriptional regulator
MSKYPFVVKRRDSKFKANYETRNSVSRLLSLLMEGHGDRSAFYVEETNLETGEQAEYSPSVWFDLYGEGDGDCPVYKFSPHTFSFIFKNRRYVRGHTLAEVSKATGVGKSTLHRIENGAENDIRMSTFLKLCTWMEIKPEVFILPDLI